MAEIESNFKHRHPDAVKINGVVVDLRFGLVLQVDEGFEQLAAVVLIQGVLFPADNECSR